MQKICVWLKNLFKKDIMLSVSLLAALVSLFMLLSVLEGFKADF